MEKNIRDQNCPYLLYYSNMINTFKQFVTNILQNYSKLKYYRGIDFKK